MKQIAEKKKVGFIDLNTPLDKKGELFTDGVHLTNDGDKVMAGLVGQALLKTNGASQTSSETSQMPQAPYDKPPAGRLVKGR